MKKKVAIFASGTGSNFERIADDSRLKEIMDIELLVCDRPGAAVIKKAEDRGIKTFVFAARDYNSKEDYKKTILNLHPSLLPKYKGKDAIAQAYNAGDKEIGISIHYVNEELDGGEVIEQTFLTVKENETLESVTNRIHGLEHELYPKVILELIKEAL